MDGLDMNEGALANLDDNKAIAELAAGKLMREIAAEYGCSKPAVYKRLSKHPDYQQAIAEQAESLVEIATNQVFECDADTVNIARARVDAAHKWAAARDPAKWGPRTQVNVTVDLGSTLQQISERMQGRVIEHDAEQQTPVLAAPDQTEAE